MTPIATPLDLLKSRRPCILIPRPPSPKLFLRHGHRTRRPQSSASQSTEERTASDVHVLLPHKPFPSILAKTNPARRHPLTAALTVIYRSRGDWLASYTITSTGPGVAGDQRSHRHLHINHPGEFLLFSQALSFSVSLPRATLTARVMPGPGSIFIVACPRSQNCKQLPASAARRPQYPVMTQGPQAGGRVSCR